jgi:predicted HTH transcriptional regulator
MLNRHHHGTVYLGVDNNGDVIGMDIGDSTLEKIRNDVRTDIVPRVIPEIEVLETDKGKQYVSISVTGHSVPYSYKEKYYVRNVTSNESADPEVVTQLVLSRGLDPLRDMPSDEQDLTFDYLFDSLIRFGQHPRNETSYYRSLGLLDDKGEFNMTAYLLSDQNSIPMQIVEFRGKDKSSIYRRRDYGNCSLLKSMDSIMSQISDYMEIEVDTDKPVRQEYPLFDFGAFKEAWVNACVHNAWRAMIPPSVLWFDDRMEIVSYGRIPFPLSKDEFYQGDSRPVNPALFRIFARLNRIEQSGHGVPKIVSVYGREAFDINESGVKVTIPFAFTPKSVLVRRNNDRNRSGLSKDKREVLDYLEMNGDAKLSDVASETGISLSSVKKIVTSLKAEGLLKNEGTNRNSIWVVNRSLIRSL